MSGVLFTNGYVPENHCRPSLQTLVTGILHCLWIQRDSIMNIKMLKGIIKFYLNWRKKNGRLISTSMP